MTLLFDVLTQTQVVLNGNELFIHSIKTQWILLGTHQHLSQARGLTIKIGSNIVEYKFGWILV